MVRTDFNQQSTIAVGKRDQYELNSTLISTEVIEYLKGEGSNKKGSEQGFSRVREVKNYKMYEGVGWSL